MRLHKVAVVQVGCIGVAALMFGLAQAQTPAPKAAQRAPQTSAAATTPQVYGNLAQVMRGILFPNSNVVFFAQSKDPAEVKAAEDPTLATDPLANSYGGWAAVENSALALAESSNLLIMPGRKCSNGRPVPVKNPDWAKFVQALRTAGMTAYTAAQSKNQDKMLDAADAVTEACTGCHNRYREKGGIAERCM
jgi:hypothetical protein